MVGGDRGNQPLPALLWFLPLFPVNVEHRFERDETPSGHTSRKTAPWVDNALLTDVAEGEHDNGTCAKVWNHLWSTRTDGWP